MNRRAFMALLGGAAAAPSVLWPRVASAQQPTKTLRVGLLSTFSPSETAPWHQALRHGLRDLGWVEGENINIEYRYAEGRLDRLPGLATDLVRLKVDLIFTDTTSPALAAKNATRTIPIVVASANDVVESGLAQSLARPGGNITGLDQIAPELGGKRPSRKSFPSSPARWCSGTHRAGPPHAIGTSSKIPHGSLGFRFIRWRYGKPTSLTERSKPRPRRALMLSSFCPNRYSWPI